MMLMMYHIRASYFVFRPASEISPPESHVNPGLIKRSRCSRVGIGIRKITALPGSMTSDENQPPPSGVNLHPPSPTALPRFGRNISDRDFIIDENDSINFFPSPSLIDFLDNFNL